MKLRELFFLNRNEKALPLRAALNLLLLTVIIVAVFWLSLTAVGVTFDFSFVSEYRTASVRVFDDAIISLASFAVSLLLGVISALEQGSRVLMLRYLCGFYVKFTRGTPLMMQIYLFFYIIGTARHRQPLHRGRTHTLIFEGAYISEIIRATCCPSRPRSEALSRGLQPEPDATSGHTTQMVTCTLHLIISALCAHRRPGNADGEEARPREVSLMLYRCRIGFVFQQGGLFHHMTARQNITVPLVHVHGFT